MRRLQGFNNALLNKVHHKGKQRRLFLILLLCSFSFFFASEVFEPIEVNAAAPVNAVAGTPIDGNTANTVDGVSLIWTSATVGDSATLAITFYEDAERTIYAQDNGLKFKVVPDDCMDFSGYAKGADGWYTKAHDSNGLFSSYFGGTILKAGIVRVTVKSAVNEAVSTYSDFTLYNLKQPEKLNIWGSAIKSIAGGLNTPISNEGNFDLSSITTNNEYISIARGSFQTVGLNLTDLSNSTTGIRQNFKVTVTDLSDNFSDLINATNPGNLQTNPQKTGIAKVTFIPQNSDGADRNDLTRTIYVHVKDPVMPSRLQTSWSGTVKWKVGYYANFNAYAYDDYGGANNSANNRYQSVSNLMYFTVSDLDKLTLPGVYPHVGTGFNHGDSKGVSAGNVRTNLAYSFRAKTTWKQFHSIAPPLPQKIYNFSGTPFKTFFERHCLFSLCLMRKQAFLIMLMVN